jgi:uncharacterized protein YndB with AHSA1/START domain
MPTRSVTHGSFTIERTYDAAPADVFHAFADEEAKSRWFTGPEEWTSGPHEFDFRVGGRERSSGGPKGGPIHRFDCIYQDIVPNERIIYTYDMHLDDARISVSLAVIQFAKAGAGTKLTLTEHGAFLDGYDDVGSRERGTHGLLDALGASLREPAGASGGAPKPVSHRGTMR